jgi:glycosyltransferase involved in cell wall biosynthesis
MKSVLFYSDAAEFGGHEAMTLEAIRCLCQRSDIAVSAIFFEGNGRMRDELSAIAKKTSGRLTLVPTTFRARSLQAFRSLFSVRKTRQLQSLMKGFEPDVIVVSQGRIESGSLGLLAAKRAGVRTISYLPMAHPVRISGSPVAVKLREIVNRYFYRLPDQFITISESSRGMLLKHGFKGTTVVVSNGIDPKPLAESDRDTFRKEHAFTQSDYVVGVIGRIDFRQKAQDFALRSISQFRHRLQGFKFLFVGDGPDVETLNAMIKNQGVSDIAQLIPWRESPAVYAGLDMLLISSRFEGVPLVMLKAMSYKLPVVASASDGMAELLPQPWLFPFGDHQALVARMLEVRNGDNRSLLERNQETIADRFTAARFCENMTAAVMDGVDL